MFPECTWPDHGKPTAIGNFFSCVCVCSQKSSDIQGLIFSVHPSAQGEGTTSQTARHIAATRLNSCPPLLDKKKYNNNKSTGFVTMAARSILVTTKISKTVYSVPCMVQHIHYAPWNYTAKYRMKVCYIRCRLGQAFEKRKKFVSHFICPYSWGQTVSSPHQSQLKKHLCIPPFHFRTDYILHIQSTIFITLTIILHPPISLLFPRSIFSFFSCGIIFLKFSPPSVKCAPFSGMPSKRSTNRFGEPKVFDRFLLRQSEQTLKKVIIRRNHPHFCFLFVFRFLHTKVGIARRLNSHFIAFGTSASVVRWFS